ncbi:MAG: hypothetical protein IPK53_00075 [bacterium]|nr:hypothetical protein [bacterium]
MATLSPNQLAQLRARMLQRSEAGTPVWPVAVRPCAELNALALLMGHLLGRLPNDDVAPLCRPILSEQLADGSWNHDVSATLEIVQALSQTQRPEVRPALNKAVAWLEEHPRKRRLRAETLLLLGFTTGLGAPLRYRSLVKPVLHAALDWNLRHEAPTRKLAAHVLLNEPGADRARTAKLVRTQLADGSWEGDVRATALALAALRQAGLPASDAIFERGYRFMRVLQQWDGNDLIQSGCDISTMLHAVTLRSLLLAGGESQELAGSALVLLQQQDQSGGWSVGSGQSVDVITTAQALDALALFGDDPLDTRWARRRAAEFLLSVQQADGSWAVLPKPMAWLRRGLRAPGSLDATSLALLALTECGESFAIRGMQRGAQYIRARQMANGSFAASSLKSRIGSTMLAAEALDAFGGQRALVERALDWIAAQQHALGGFGETEGLTSWHTALAIRGMSLRPARYAEPLATARAHLLLRQDDQLKIWVDPAPTLFLPGGTARQDVHELSTLAALEAMNIGSRARASRNRMQRAKLSRG